MQRFFWQTVHNWSLQLFSKGYEIASYITLVMCVLILSISALKKQIFLRNFSVTQTQDYCMLLHWYIGIWPSWIEGVSQFCLKQAETLQRSEFSIVIGVISVHYIMGTHASRIDSVHAIDFCRSCRDEEEYETVLQLLCTYHGTVTTLCFLLFSKQICS